MVSFVSSAIANAGEVSLRNQRHGKVHFLSQNLAKHKRDAAFAPEWSYAFDNQHFRIGHFLPDLGRNLIFR